LRDNAEYKARTKAEEFRVGRSVADFLASERYVVRLDRERDRLVRELAAAEVEKEGARLEYVELRKARESIGKLKERRQAEYYRLALRDETKQLDDLARNRIVSDPASKTAAGVEG
jgi:flagellar protein FliJ